MVLSSDYDKPIQGTFQKPTFPDQLKYEQCYRWV